MKHPAYERITERIVTLLEQGTIPWRKPWNTRTGWPRNQVSHKPYRGINVFLLASAGYESPLWLTYRQALQLGGSVRQGEKACPVVFWKPFKVEDEASGEERKIPLLRLYHVFNAAQCDGLKDTPPPSAAEVVPTGSAKIVAEMPQPPVIKHGLREACYSPSEDYVGLPNRERFDTEDAYYATLFHELVHSTGHAKRLNRPAIVHSSTGFGSDPYCREELVAEMGAAFLCGHGGIEGGTMDNSAAYIKGWLARLQEDKTFIVQAAAQAQKAADYILGTKATEAAP